MTDQLRVFFATRGRQVVFMICTRQEWESRIETDGTLTGETHMMAARHPGVLMSPEVFDNWLMNQVVPWWQDLKGRWPATRCRVGTVRDGQPVWCTLPSHEGDHRFGVDG